MDSEKTSGDLETRRTEGAVKTYEIKTTSLSGLLKNFEIRHESSDPILIVNVKGRALGFTNPQVHIQLPDKTVIAACKLKGLGWNFDKLLYLGNPDCSDPANWIELQASGIIDPSIYQFRWKGGLYSWRRTHNSQHDSSKLQWETHKLVKEDSGTVLCVYVHKWSWKHGYSARMDFTVSLFSAIR